MKMVKGFLFVILVGVTSFVGCSVVNFLFDNSKSLSIPSLYDGMLNGDTIHIVGVNNYSRQSLLETKNIVESTYGVPVVIDNPISINNEYKIDRNINSSKLIISLNSDKNTILVTSDVCVENENNKMIGGLSLHNDNILILNDIVSKKSLKRVIIHEIGHSEGLGHCDDKTCYMSINRNDNEVTHFCDKCKK